MGFFWGIQNNLKICVEKAKMFLGVPSVVRMTTRCRKDNFRWYDESTNTNIHFLMFLFLCYMQCLV